MSAQQEIRTHAEMFGWECHADRQRRQDTFVHAGNMVAVDYRRDGAVNVASRSTFVTIEKLQVEEIAAAQHRRSKVIAWLVRFGS